MPVTDFDSIDDVIIEKEQCLLVIEDDLDWEEEYDHISAIQNKLKSYVYFIESKQLENKYPDAPSENIVISLRAEHPVPEHYFDLLSNQIALVLSNAGLGFEWVIA